MTRARCRVCRTPQQVESLREACVRCKRRTLVRAVRPARIKKPKRARIPLCELPPEGRKLRRFLDAMGWSERQFAEHITSLGHGRIGRSYVSGLVHGRKGARFEIARGIAGTMRRYGYSPSEFFPGVNNLQRPRKPVRRDWFAWQKRRQR